ncbi:hypothetical protein D1B33_02695 [Lysinibacillus yapensis]|uniref:YlaH-like protein n=1 Tax=Ureibacillus yapensis TaxID=2304605 RepID=A0A396SDV5_9BACL|nr:YlaH-like family protein [Lysinibacillus yapensis]RHW39776.1 hypothetical protein D1B33_02695 [Lysinibacillus yapensis]
MNYYGILNYISASAPTNASENAFVFNRMSGITRYLYENMPSYQLAGYATFILVFVLSAIVYKLGFAKNDLKLVQNVIIYIFLFIGCIVLTFLALFLPMIEGLIVAALILILYKTRLWREKREEKRAAS